MLGLVIAVGARDTEPALHDLVCQQSGGVLARVVCHEPEDERVRSRLYKNAGERSVEEVFVGSLLGVEASCPESCQGVDRENSVRRGTVRVLVERTYDS